MTLRNFGQTETLVQLTMVEWSMANGEDVHTATQDIIATPPIFTIPAGEQQIVRLGLRHPAPAPAERSYRLFLQEVPSENPEDPGVQVTLRIGIPVFVAPAAPPKPALDWQANVSDGGALQIQATNTGNVHVKLTHIRLLIPESEGERILDDNFVYLLPDATKRWTLESAEIAPGDRLRVLANTDTAQGEIKVTLEPGSP